MKPKISKTHLFYAGAIFLCMFLGMGNMLGFGKEVFMIVLGITTAVLSFFYPSVPLYILILGIPLESKTVALTLGKAFNFTNVMLILMFTGWVMRAAIYKERFIVKTPLNIPMGIYMLIAVFSYLIGYIKWDYDFMGDQMTAFKQTMMFFVLFFFALNCVRTKKEMAVGLVLIGLMTFYETTVGIRQHHLVEHSTYQDESRVVGTFGSEKEDSVVGANEMGTFLAQYSAIFLAGLLVARNPLVKMGFLGLYAMTGYAVMNTFSRAAYVSMIIAVGVTVIFKSRKLIFPLIIAGCIVMVIAPGPVRERFMSIRYEDQSIVTRRNMWADTRYYILKSPLFGHGYAGSGYILSRDTHNMYYDVALEMGIPAAFLLLYIFYKIFKVASTVYKTSQDNLGRLLSLAVIGAVITMALCNYFGTRLHFFPINGHFAILAGMAARIYAKKQEQLRHHASSVLENRETL